MEQHPVPQNIASFEFKLIGDITLKQFAYVGGGLFVAYLATKFTLVPSLLRWPVAGGIAFLGVGLAFFPVNGQPLDRWLGAFVKSIYAPTQFVWQKDNQPPDYITSDITTQQTTPPTIVKVKNPPPSLTTSTTPQATTVVAQPPPPAIPKSPAASPTQFKLAPVTPSQKPAPVTFSAIPVPKTPATPSTPITPPKPQRWVMSQAPTSSMKPSPPPPPPKHVLFDQKMKPPTPPSHNLQPKTATDQITDLQKEIQAGHVAKERLLEMQQLLASLTTEKDQLSKELIKLRQQVSSPQPQVVTPVINTPSQNTSTTTVKIVAPLSTPKTNIPSLTTVPNVITGIIKDSQGILLPNMIVTVKDHEHMPVRALKTNKLGQFAASTSLANGVYVLEVEDPSKRFGFTPIQISLSGQVLPPLEISATNQRDLMRQKLTREIFGKNTL